MFVYELSGCGFESHSCHREKEKYNMENHYYKRKNILNYLIKPAGEVENVLLVLLLCIFGKRAWNFTFWNEKEFSNFKKL